MTLSIRLSQSWLMLRRCLLIALAYIGVVQAVVGPWSVASSAMSMDSMVWCAASEGADGLPRDSAPHPSSDMSCCILVSAPMALALASADIVLPDVPPAYSVLLRIGAAEGRPSGFPISAQGTPRAPPSFS